MKADTWRRYGLSASALLFMFSGLYKTLVTAPVDLTLVAAVITLGLLVYNSSSRHIASAVLTRWAALLLGGIVVWCAIRIVPDFNFWGLRKLGDTAVFGLIAISAGIVVGGDADVRRSFQTLAVWLCLPAAALILVNALSRNSYFVTLGGGGYQLTGLFLSMLATAAASARNSAAAALAIFAVTLTGSIGGALFGGMAVMAVWIHQSHWKVALRAVGAVVVLIGVYTLATGAAPLSIQRALTQATGLISILSKNSSGSTLTAGNEFPASASIGGEAERTIADEVNATSQFSTSTMDIDAGASLTVAEESAGSRVSIWTSAVDVISQNWLFGAGYGNVIYGTSPMAHNVFLELFAETGFFGAALLVLFVVCWGKDATSHSLSLGLSVLIILDMMVSAVWGTRIAMFVIGLSIGAGWLSGQANQSGLQRSPTGAKDGGHVFGVRSR